MSLVSVYPAHSPECKHIDFDYEGRRYVFHEASLPVEDDDDGIILDVKVHCAGLGITTAEAARTELNGKEF